VINLARTACLVAVHLFLLKDNQILLQRRAGTGYEDGNYSVIAGHIDGGEDVFSAMRREAKEEGGIDIALDNLQVVQVMHRKKEDERIDYFFVCKQWDGEVRIMEPNKCDEIRWADIDALPQNTVDYIVEAIKNYREGIMFSIYGWGNIGGR